MMSTQAFGAFLAACAILGVAGMGVAFASETRGGKAFGISGDAAAIFVVLLMLTVLLVYIYVITVPA